MFKHGLSRITFSLVNAPQWLRAFQDVFPSCAGPTLHDLLHGEPVAVAALLPDDGALRASYTPAGLGVTELVSVTNGRAFRAPRRSDSFEITFPGGSRTAAAELVALVVAENYGVDTYFWWADPDDVDDWARGSNIGRAAPPPIATDCDAHGDSAL